MVQACKFLDEKWCPKFLVIVAQKNHHTKFFQQGSPDNVPPGKRLLIIFSPLQSIFSYLNIEIVDDIFALHFNRNCD